MKPGALVFAGLTLVLVGCRKQGAETQPTDCGEDIECYVARASQCLPASVTMREVMPAEGAFAAVTTRYEAMGWVQGRCHLQRTQLEPTWAWPDAGTVAPRGDAYGDSRRLQENPFSNAAGTLAPLMQCLLPGEQVAAFMKDIRTGRMTPADWAPCYPGDGRCGPLPRLTPGCVPDECLLGRWTFVCMDNRGRTLSECEGTRLSDNSPKDSGCVSTCESGREVLDCDFSGSKQRRERPLRTEGGALQ